MSSLVSCGKSASTCSSDEIVASPSANNVRKFCVLAECLSHDMDDGRIGGEMTLEGIAKQLEKIQSGIAAVRSDIKTVDGNVDSLDHKMTIEFEETRRVVNLGFENTQMLREEVGRRFDDTDRG